jgi:ABC-type branched-subunit amino acid transport system ATPase component
MVLAMSMQHQPQMLLLDEPLTGLTGKNIDLVKEKVQNLNQKYNTTILLIEHRINDILPIANRVFGLKLGNFTEINKNDPLINSLITKILI